MDFASVLPFSFALYFYFCIFASDPGPCGGVGGVAKQVHFARILQADT